MKKRSRYRPKGVLLNPLGYVLEGMKPVKSHDSYLINLKIANHGAMAALTQGKATRADMDVLINMINVVEALYRLGFGEEYGREIAEGLTAIRDIGRRGAKTNHFVVKASEMNALNTVIDLHDAQMDIITIRDMENAMKLMQEEYAQGKMNRILETAS